MNWPDERAVSEVLGYVMTFSLVVTAASLLFVAGQGTVGDIRDDEQINNGDRAMIALAENMNDLSSARGPKREGEIRLAGGTLTFDDGAAMTVTVDDGGTTVGPTPIGSGSLVYALNDRSVRYESGAVFRGGPESVVMEREPGLRCTGENAILSSLSLSLASGNADSYAKRGSVLIVGERVESTLLYPESPDPSAGEVDVTLDVTSINGDAWDRYLTDSGWTETGASTYRCTADDVIVRETVVRIDVLS